MKDKDSGKGQGGVNMSEIDKSNYGNKKQRENVASFSWRKEGQGWAAR